MFPGGCRVSVDDIDVGWPSYEHGVLRLGGLPRCRDVVVRIGAELVGLGSHVDLHRYGRGVSDTGLGVDGGEVRLDELPELRRYELAGRVECCGHGGGNLVPRRAGLPVQCVLLAVERGGLRRRDTAYRGVVAVLGTQPVVLPQFGNGCLRRLASYRGHVDEVWPPVEQPVPVPGELRCVGRGRLREGGQSVLSDGRIYGVEYDVLEYQALAVLGGVSHEAGVPGFLQVLHPVGEGIPAVDSRVLPGDLHLSGRIAGCNGHLMRVITSRERICATRATA